MLSLIAFAGILANIFAWYARPGMWLIFSVNILCLTIFFIRHLQFDWEKLEGIDWSWMDDFELPEIDIDIDISCGD